MKNEKIIVNPSDILKNIDMLCQWKDDQSRVTEVTREPQNKITQAPEEPALAPFTRVAVETRAGKKSLIRTEVWLPDNWNGILVGVGNGGLAGSIHVPSMKAQFYDGYAVVHTDLGTSAGESAGYRNPDMWADFGWRATHLMTDVAKSLLRLTYGRDPSYAYFIGSSTGGEQAFSEAERFPHDYDGIIAGVPVIDRVNLHLYFLWNHLHLCRPDDTALFTREEAETLHGQVLRFYQSNGDGKPGDEFISRPLFDVRTQSALLSVLARSGAFSEEQLSALRAVWSGPVLSDGTQVYGGMPAGSELFYCGIMTCQNEKPPFPFPISWTFGKKFDPRSIPFDDIVREVNATLSADLNACDPDLTPFADHGGVMIAFSGTADPCVPFHNALDFSHRIRNSLGDRSPDVYRYFLIPGRAHSPAESPHAAEPLGADGVSPLLSVLRRWREDHVAPAALRCPPLSRLICPVE